METAAPLAIGCRAALAAAGEHADARWSRFAGWIKSSKELAFVYNRSLGGLIHSGRACIPGLDRTFIDLRTAGSTAVIVMKACS